MLSMPSGTDPLIVLKAAREFARIEFADHRYVMVLHTHQANPHVHLSVKAESKHGERLNPKKADLHRWRETFAETAARVGNRRRGDPASSPGGRSQLSGSLAEESGRGGQGAQASTRAQGRRGCHRKS